MFFISSRTCVFPFCNSVRNLTTLVKGNRLPLLRENCSARPKLLAYKFLSILIRYLWSYSYFLYHYGPAFFYFATSVRNLTTLVKGNRLPLLRENCSACPNLL